MKTFLLALTLSSSASLAAVIESDLCIYGGTSGGVAAAVQGSRMGKSVVIAESGKHLGGMTSGGLGAKMRGIL
jgi:ribulose 1,5-bisphosphate synthetase/thiazole synthase